MRKLLVLTLAVAIGAIAFADDALVMPKGVLRIYFAPSYGFIKESFDDSGDRQDLTEEIALFNVGAALEYGMTDQITVAAQWVPGYTMWSKFDPEPAPFGEAKVNGPFDLFVGAKFQILGPKAFVPNQKMRPAAAPGVLIPMPGAKKSDESKNMLDDEKWIAKELDKHAFGLGLRGYYDYLFSKEFFVNLYAEYIYFLEKEYDDSVNYGDATVRHGYQLKLEVEPQYEFAAADGITVQAGLAGMLKLAPETEIDGLGGLGNDSYLFSVKPNVSAFFMKTPVPLEFKASYVLPLLGKNDFAANFFVLEARVYLKF